MAFEANLFLTKIIAGPPSMCYSPRLSLTTVLRRVIMFVDSGGSAHALTPKPHHLRITPVDTILGENILCLHFKCRVVLGDDASAALAVLHTHDLAEDLLIEVVPRADCMNMKEQEQAAVLCHLHLILILLHCSVYAKHHVDIVIDSVGVLLLVGHREAVSVSGLDGETGCHCWVGVGGSSLFPADGLWEGFFVVTADLAVWCKPGWTKNS